MKFSSEQKEVKEFKDDYFTYGVHKVKLGVADHGKTEDGKEYIDITVVSEDGEKEDTARVWFTTEKSINYSFNVLRTIIVHNAPEAKKDEARKLADAVETTEALADLINEKCMGGDLWFTKYPDPERTYTNQAGEVKKSINKNVMGYEPKERPELLPKEQKAVDPADYPNDEPFGDDEGKTAANTVPDKKSW